MKKLFRIGAGVLGAVISAGALFMFAGCTSDTPEIRITYKFNNKEYVVDYVLSRRDAPQTTQHFIELADAGYFEGMCIHDFTDTAMYTGGYKLVDGDLEEVNYLEEVEKLVANGTTFTHTVYANEQRTVPLYSVYGEFKDNGLELTDSRVNQHSQGALVMYYTPKGNNAPDVYVRRADGGKDNGGEEWQKVSYEKNSATSLFYTYLGSSTNYNLGDKYCVFGMAKDYETQLKDGLLQAIADYKDTLSDDEEFTTLQERFRINRYDYFEAVRTSGATAEPAYATPVDEPITIVSVKVTKY